MVAACSSPIPSDRRGSARPVRERERSPANAVRRYAPTLGVGHPARISLDRAEAFETAVIGGHGGTLADRVSVGNAAGRILRRSAVPVEVIR